MATVVNGTFTGVATGATVTPINPGEGAFSLSGTFVATVVTERSFDGGTTWVQIASNTSATEANFLTSGSDIIYRLRCSAFTSGTVVYSIAVPTAYTDVAGTATTKNSPWYGAH